MASQPSTFNPQLFQQHFDSLAESPETAARTTATHLLDATLHQILIA